MTDPIACSAGCKRTVATDAEADAKAWAHLPITGRRRCPDCTRELRAVDARNDTNGVVPVYQINGPREGDFVEVGGIKGIYRGRNDKVPGDYWIEFDASGTWSYHPSNVRFTGGNAYEGPTAEDGPDSEGFKGPRPWNNYEKDAK